ncbi:MAG: PTS sugar transporter subunit IIB [Elusimicrobiota bacterium]
MPIVLARIDDRLIHGQVVEGWLPALKVRRVVVVCDDAEGDPTQTALMQLCLPESVALEVRSVKDGPEALRRADSAAERTMVLVPGPSEMLALLEGGARLESVNVGGLHYVAGTVRLGKAIFLSAEDVRALEAIAARGVRIEGRAVPTESPSDVMALIRSRG